MDKDTLIQLLVDLSAFDQSSAVHFKDIVELYNDPDFEEDELVPLVQENPDDFALTSEGLFYLNTLKQSDMPWDENFEINEPEFFTGEDEELE